MCMVGVGISVITKDGMRPLSVIWLKVHGVIDCRPCMTPSSNNAIRLQPQITCCAQIM